MTRSVPALADITQQQLRDISNQLPDADVSKDSDYAIRANAVSGVAQGLYNDQTWILRQIFADTADHDWLVMHARSRGLSPKAASAASGQAAFAGSAGVNVTSGLQFRPAGSNGLYQTTEDVTIDNDGTATVSASALTAGAAGNLGDNKAATLLSAPQGIDSAVTILTMRGGTDAENDTSLLSRLLELMRRPPAGGNKYDYRRWAMEVSGVSEAYVYPLRRGYGTVDVVITASGDLPSDETIKAVQAYIDDQRPVTAKDTLVLAPEPVDTDITAKVSLDGLSLDEARTQITQVLTDYFSRLAPGEIAVRTQMGALISDITGVVDYELVTPTGNIVPEVSDITVQWIRPGTISISELK
ncbi:baseplate J/gp47 family protein [Erwinia psidii]|uniref:baseplate J/gp47 family protein n=1 Tax=Erwinia psidii TaxID=69224 RepID=UPI00226B9BFC|nr:baseplate J/gp47 family protein [Erwinia psidii]MCX8957233.1 baseplate J/gp47 family protein [Erwinia psidii]